MAHFYCRPVATQRPKSACILAGRGHGSVQTSAGAGSFHHVAGVYDQDEGLHMYFDGELDEGQGFFLAQFWGQLTSHQETALLSGMTTDTKAASGTVK